MTIKRSNLALPGYKIGAVNTENAEMVSYYGLESIPKTYIDNAPDFQSAADTLRDYLRKCYPMRSLCIRGVDMAAHNRINGCSLGVDDLADIIGKTGSDRYNPAIPGDGYQNVENKPIDFFAYDVYPCKDDEDLIYFFMSFYYFSLSRLSIPSLLDLITVYDRDRLALVEHRYAGRDDVKRDGFTFSCSDRTNSVLEIINIRR